MRWKRNVFLMLGLVMGIFFGSRQWEITALAAELTNLHQKTGPLVEWQLVPFAAELTGFRQKIERQTRLWMISASTTETVSPGPETEQQTWQQGEEMTDIDLTGIQEYLDQIDGDDTVGLTFRDLMDMIRKGDAL